jgi:beta-glucosidase
VTRTPPILILFCASTGLLAATPADIAQPIRELKGFRRIHLKSGEKITAQFDLTAGDLAYYRPLGEFSAAPGGFQVWIAPDSAARPMAEFRLVQ